MAFEKCISSGFKLGDPDFLTGLFSALDGKGEEAEVEASAYKPHTTCKTRLPQIPPQPCMAGTSQSLHMRTLRSQCLPKGTQAERERHRIQAGIRPQKTSSSYASPGDKDGNKELANELKCSHHLESHGNKTQHIKRVTEDKSHRTEAQVSYIV